MKTLIIPKFDKDINFLGYKEIQVKNKFDSADYIKVCSELPGLTCGYCSSIYSITRSGKPVEIINFYDIRQRGVQRLKHFFIALKTK